MVSYYCPSDYENPETSSNPFSAKAKAATIYTAQTFCDNSTVLLRVQKYEATGSKSECPVRYVSDEEPLSASSAKYSSDGVNDWYNVSFPLPILPETNSPALQLRQ